MLSNEALDTIKSRLTGNTTGRDAIKLLTNAIQDSPASRWYTEALEAYSIAGTTFCLPEDKDLSEMGVAMRWMSPEESLDEINNAYPGIAAHKRGYIPVGVCLEGSGDPYFLRTDREDHFALVRIPHDACREDELNETQVEVICEDVSEFFLNASIEE